MQIKDQSNRGSRSVGSVGKSEAAAIGSACPTLDLKQDTVSAQVVRHLLQSFEARRLRPGDIVDGELQVARELAVSRGSVREAYRILAALGVLDIGNGRRPRVNDVDPAALAHIFGHSLKVAHATPLHVLEFRRAVEVHAAQLAARFASEDQCKKLRELMVLMRTCVRDDRQRRVHDLDLHETIAAASNNPLNTLVLAALHTAITESLERDYEIQRTEKDVIRVIDAHELIVDRICGRDPVGAGAAMSCHFDLSINSMSHFELSAPSSPDELVTSSRK